MHYSFFVGLLKAFTGSLVETIGEHRQVFTFMEARAHRTDMKLTGQIKTTFINMNITVNMKTNKNVNFNSNMSVYCCMMHLQRSFILHP